MTTHIINGIDVPGLRGMVEQVSQDSSQAAVKIQVTSDWTGQTSSLTKTKIIAVGNKVIERSFTIGADEPKELLGQDLYANAQEILFAALNACMIVGYVAGAAMHGITLEKVEIETEGDLDLRGFLGLDESIAPGLHAVRYTVRIKGNGTPEQFQQIHENVIKTSPNRYNIASAITLVPKLIVE